MDNIKPLYDNMEKKREITIDKSEYDALMSMKLSFQNEYDFVIQRNGFYGDRIYSKGRRDDTIIALQEKNEELREKLQHLVMVKNFLGKLSPIKRLMFKWV